MRAADPTLFLLNEMPFGDWLASDPIPDPARLRRSHELHELGLQRLEQLGAPIVLGTRPAFELGRSVNQGFVWQADSGARPVHTKQYFPDEKGYYEARWFERGETHFRLADAGGLRLGFLICTEVMFTEWARHYGRRGAHLLVVPRATPARSTERWKTAIRMAAIVSGCYVASSNRSGADRHGLEFGGRGWIVEPGGRILAETSARRPVVTADVDVERVARARRDYPCYVRELPGNSS